MNTTPRMRRELAWFFAGTFVPTVALAVFAMRSGNPAALIAVTPLSMLTPALSALAVQKLVARQPIFGASPFAIHWGRLRWWLLGPLAFALFVFASIVASFVVTPSLQVSFVQFASNVAGLRGLPVAGLPTTDAFALAIGISFVVGPVLNIPIFLGEELGWRGFMNPRLVELCGRSGLLLGGAIWAVWHLPIILLGHNYPTHPFTGLLVWVPVCICLNILLQDLKERAGSIFPSALAHGVMNQIAPIAMGVLFVKSEFVDYLHGPAGLVGLAVLFVPAAIVFARWPSPRSDVALPSDLTSKGRTPDLRSLQRS